MQFGLIGINQGQFSNADAAIAVAQEAETIGFDSLWVGEHVVLPDPLVPPQSITPNEPILDPIVSLTFLAAYTRKILLGTGVIILPQRNPLVLAKSLASLDVLSAGRLIFGIGVGYLEAEMRALGIPLEHRGTRADEYLRSIIALWTQLEPTFHGDFVNYADIQAYPRPVQQPHPRIVIGGRTVFAHRRAVRYGNGWYGFNLNPSEAAQQLASLREATKKYKRKPGLGKLEISVTPKGEVSLDDIHHFAQIGVDRLIFQLPQDVPIDHVRGFLLETRELFI